jgi:ABC-type multidrug transport system ATPase subunit
MNISHEKQSQTVKESAFTGLAIEAKSLSKAFGRAHVLRGLDLEVPWGQILTILGPNGSGKTTLIKILATLTRPDAGVVRIAGLDAARYGQRVRRLVGVVTHDALLYDDLTAYENLKFFARMFGLDRIEERVASAAERMGVSARLHQRVGTLSHGMRKRFTLARALLHDPLILLMDEPESGLDQEALAMLEKVVSDRSVPYRTILLTTHNLERGLALGDRMAILAHGRIAYQESLESVGVAALRDAYFRYTGAATP